VLVVINRGSYDDGHVTAIGMVVAGHLPRAGDCDECYQPQLYYVICGLLARLLGVSATDRSALHVVGQVVSGLAGVVTLWAAWRMLAETRLSARLRRLAFALFACNATLIAMFVQATNDAFVIAFGSLAVVFTLRLVRTRAARPLDTRTVILLTLACIAASLSKATGVVVASAVGVLLVWHAATGSRSSETWRAGRRAVLIFAVPYLLIVPLLGGYADDVVRLGSPVGVTVPETGPSAIGSQQTTGREFFQRIGIVSVVDYFTLKPWDILAMPWHTSAPRDLGSARTSLWTQVFARSHFVFFEQWPVQWYDTDDKVIVLGRAIFILGWITTVFTLIGFGFALYAVFRRRRDGRPWPALWTESGVAVTLMGALLVALIAFTYRYRHEGTMKAMYLYPVLLCALWAFARGVRGVRTNLRSRRGNVKLFDAAVGTSVIAVCGLYVAQLATLIQAILVNG
jgi:hypothetical protein